MYGMGDNNMSRRLFCSLGPRCYRISLEKEILKRKIKNLFDGCRIAKDRSDTALANIVKGHSSILVRRLNGVDIRLQENKVTNIELACEKINGLVIHPGETFSYWATCGRPTKRKGYKEGLMICRNGMSSGIGGGLCQMGNMIHWLVLNSPLTVTELHHHSDALFPDERRRVPFGTGTSICYNRVDYRFKNTTDQDVQILVWCENGDLCGELRSERPFPERYRLVEEDHHFQREGDKFFRVSKVYRLVIDRESGETIRKELILDNHSEVMYDYSLIPAEQIRDA
jgi:vancomycin resistance protein VanW